MIIIDKIIKEYEEIKLERDNDDGLVKFYGSIIKCGNFDNMMWWTFITLITSNLLKYNSDKNEFELGADNFIDIYNDDIIVGERLYKFINEFISNNEGFEIDFNTFIFKLTNKILHDNNWSLFLSIISILDSEMTEREFMECCLDHSDVLNELKFVRLMDEDSFNLYVITSDSYTSEMFDIAHRAIYKKFETLENDNVNQYNKEATMSNYVIKIIPDTDIKVGLLNNVEGGLEGFIISERGLLYLNKYLLSNKLDD